MYRWFTRWERSAVSGQAPCHVHEKRFVFYPVRADNTNWWIDMFQAASNHQSLLYLGNESPTNNYTEGSWPSINNFHRHTARFKKKQTSQSSVRWIAVNWIVCSTVLLRTIFSGSFGPWKDIPRLGHALSARLGKRLCTVDGCMDGRMDGGYQMDISVCNFMRMHIRHIRISIYIYIYIHTHIDIYI